MSEETAEPCPTMTTEVAASTEEEAEVILVNDVLAFMQCKLDTLNKEQLIDILHGFYKLDAITDARDTLYRDPPSDLPGRLKRRTCKRDILEDMYDVLQLYGVHAAKRIYVCRNLNNIPPVTMKNIDPVMLYRQTIDCRSEVEQMKKDHEQQLATLMDIIVQLRLDIGKVIAAPATSIATSSPIQTSVTDPIVIDGPEEAPTATGTTPFRDKLVKGLTSLKPVSTAPPPPPPPPAPRETLKL